MKYKKRMKTGYTKKEAVRINIKWVFYVYRYFLFLGECYGG